MAVNAIIKKHFVILQKFSFTLLYSDRHFLLSLKKTIINCFMLLVCFFIVPSLLSAQNSEDKMLAEELSKKGEVKIASVPQLIYTQNQKTLAESDFENFEISKANFENEINYRAGSIDRSYAVNNPFDMEDLNNPFNLSRSGSKTGAKVKKKDSQSMQKFFGALFEYRQMPKKTIINKKPEMVPPAWMLFSLIAVLSVFAYQTVVFKAENRKTIQAFVSNSSALQQFRDQKTLLTPYKLLSDCLFAIAMGHFVYVGSNVYLHSLETDYNWSFANLLLSIAGISGLMSLKNLQSKLLGTVFPFRQALSYNHFLMNNAFRVMALVLTPLLFFLTYSPESIKIFSLYTGLFLFITTGIYSFFRMTIASTELILENKFHFFIYLCGVELAPVLILLKLLSVI
jgi:hypothetical protein